MNCTSLVWVVYCQFTILNTSPPIITCPKIQCLLCSWLYTQISFISENNTNYFSHHDRLSSWIFGNIHPHEYFSNIHESNSWKFQTRLRYTNSLGRKRCSDHIKKNQFGSNTKFLLFFKCLCSGNSKKITLSHTKDLASETVCNTVCQPIQQLLSNLLRFRTAIYFQINREFTSPKFPWSMKYGQVYVCSREISKIKMIKIGFSQTKMG